MRVFIDKEIWDRFCKPFFAGAFSLVLIFSLLYVYFINLTVLKTAERTSNLTKLSILQTEFQELESFYIERVGQFNISYAHSAGFVDAEPQIYIQPQKTMVQGLGYGDFR